MDMAAPQTVVLWSMVPSAFFTAWVAPVLNTGAGA